MEFDKVIRERHSVRNYSSKEVKLIDVVTIMHAGRFVPMAGNISSIRFVVVNDNEVKKELGDAACGQHFLAKAKYIIIVCSDVKQLRRAYGERGLMYAKQQAGASVQNMLLKTVDLGLGGCWIGAFDEKAVKRILQIPDEICAEAMIPIGYSAGKKVERKKLDLDKITFMNFWEG